MSFLIAAVRNRKRGHWRNRKRESQKGTLGIAKGDIVLYLISTMSPFSFPQPSHRLVLLRFAAEQRRSDSLRLQPQVTMPQKGQSCRAATFCSRRESISIVRAPNHAVRTHQEQETSGVIHCFLSATISSEPFLTPRADLMQSRDQSQPSNTHNLGSA